VKRRIRSALADLAELVRQNKMDEGDPHGSRNSGITAGD
jgi:hypothetical protein